MRIFLTLLFLALSACTTIEITDNQGNLTIERSFGFAAISPGSSTGAISAKVTNFGYVSTPLGHNLGYSDHSILLSDSSCKVVVWLQDSLSEEEISQLNQIGSVCINNED